jgi:putative colanic acid biosynthesis glycosyltransferase
LKVLLIDVNCKNSSTGKIVYDLYSFLRKNGDDAAVCYGRGPLVEEENILKFGYDAETDFHALMTRLTGYTGCWSHFSTGRLIRFIDEFQPDIIHIHELHAYFVNLKPLLDYIKEKRIRTVWTFHCEFMYTGKCGHAYECNRWQDGCGRCPRLHDYVSTLAFDRTAEMLKQKKEMFRDFPLLKIVSPSQWLADRIRQSFLKDRDIRVIRNGIDTDLFRPRKTAELRKKNGIAPGEKVVFAAAPDLLSEGKGGRRVLELAEKMKGEGIRFAMAGISSLQQEFPENVLPMELIRDQELLAQWYSLADAFVICSKRENYPTTCLEALACGTPVCGFDTGGTKETDPEHPENFVPYGDMEALAERIRSLTAAAKTGRSHVRSSSEMLEDYRKLYQEETWESLY